MWPPPCITTLQQNHFQKKISLLLSLMPMLLSLQFLPTGNNELLVCVSWRYTSSSYSARQTDISLWNCKIWDVLLRSFPIKIILPFITTFSVTNSKCKLQPHWTALWINCLASVCPQRSCTCYYIFSKKPLQPLLSVAFHCNSGP